jgi:DNA polymerase III subunit gamma/tau
LYYQIALHGRRDLALAPDEYAGFTMTLMRMALFRPESMAAEGATQRPVAPTTRSIPAVKPPATSALQARTPPAAMSTRSAPAAPVTAAPAPATPAAAATPFDGNWPDLVRSLKISGMAKQLADRTELVQFDSGKLILAVAQQDRGLAERPFQERLRQAVAERLGQPIHLEVRIGVTTGVSVAANDEADRQARANAANSMMNEDPFVRALVSGFDARIESIKPLT